MGSVTRHIRRNIMRRKLEHNQFTKVNRRMSVAWYQYFRNEKIRKMLDKE